MNFKPPHDWIECPSVGCIVNDLFIPFKTPLDDKFNNYIEPTKRFNLKILFDMEKCRGLKAIIDLTFTNKYYKYDEIDTNVNFIKLSCRGHDKAPDLEEVEKFIRTVKFYLTDDKALVGVHCTQGFNRTGFMIICYLVEKCDLSLDIAVSLFKLARPPGIYKQDYLDELVKRYGFPMRLMSEPRPNWQADNLDKNCFPKQILDKDEFRLINDMLKSMLKFQKDGFFGSQPVTLTHENAYLLTKERYFITWKADGERFLLFYRDIDHIYLINRSYKIFRLKTKKCFERLVSIYESLLDVELVYETCGEIGYWLILIFDIIIWNSVQVATVSFAQRLDIMQQYIPYLDKDVKKNNGDVLVDLKKYFHPHESQYVLELELQHQTDGIIFQPGGALSYYTLGTNTQLLKWKPPNLNSIDFKLICFPNKYNKNVFIGFLYVSGMKEWFAKIDNIDQTTYDKLNEKIVECTYEPKCRKWTIMRERSDKINPNYVKVADNIYKSLQDPFTLDDLYGIIFDIPENL